MALTCTKCNTPLTPQQAGEPCPNCGSMDRKLTAEEQATAAEKAKVAKELAKRPFQIEPGLTKVIRFSGSAPVAFRPTEPIKLLEVNQNTVASGVLLSVLGLRLQVGLPFRRSSWK